MSGADGMEDEQIILFLKIATKEEIIELLQIFQSDELMYKLLNEKLTIISSQY